MAGEILVKVTHNGGPVADADVTVMAGGAGSGRGKSDKAGKAMAVKKDGEPVLVYIKVESDSISFGGGPYEVIPGVEFTIEV